MKQISSVITLLLALLVTYPCFAAPTLTTPATTNTGANITTLLLQSSETGTGYFTLLSGNSAICGSGVQVKAGLNSSGTAAPYFGSLPLTAAANGYYTLRNLTGSTAYTVCFSADSPSGSNLNQNPVAANLTTTTTASLTGIDWTDAASAGFTQGAVNSTSLAFAPNGNPYVAFQDWGNNGNATVMKYSEGVWSTVGNAGFSAGMANSTSLAFAPDGTPYVAYGDGGNSGKATVKKYSGSNWVTVGIAGFSAGPANFTSLAFAPDGSPFVAYGDNGSSGKATVMKYSAGAWIAVGIPGFSAGQADYTSLAIAPDGAPHVAYYDYGNSGKATVMKFNGSGWLPVGSPGISDLDAGFTSLAIAPDGTLHVAYSDYANSAKATVKKYSNSAWSTVGTPGFSAGQADYTSLAFAPDSTPYIAYGDGNNIGKATVMKFSNNTWTSAGTAGFSAGTANATSLAFSPDGTPCVAYGDDGNSSRATLMKLKNPPTISGTPPVTATTGIAYNFTPTATNADSFTISGKPPELSFNTITGELSGTPTTTGTFSTIIITAINSLDAAALQTFSISVFGTSAPETQITGQPNDPTTTTTAIFTFTSPDITASFECQLDAGSFTPCTTGINYNSLAIGSHTFNVRASNTEGNTDATPASYSWTINSSASTLVKIGVKNYATLNAALLEAINGDRVKILATLTPEGLNYSGSGIITLEGGYDAGWNRQPNLFSSVSSLTVSNGTLILDQIEVK